MSVLSMTHRDYDRALKVLREKLAAGEIQVGDRLPPVRALAATLEAQRETVRRVLWQLADDGLLEIRQGSGTYVRALPNSVEATSKRVAVYLPYVNGEIMYTPALFREFEHRPERPYRFDVVTSADSLAGLPLQDYHGVIAVTPTHDVMQQIMKATDGKTPTVALSRTYFDLPMRAVLEDNYGAAYELTSWLLMQGHREVTFMADEVCRGSAFLQARLHGWKAALEEAGLDPDKQRVCWFVSDNKARLISAMSDYFRNTHTGALFFSMGVFLEEALRLIALDQLDFVERRMIACIDTNGDNSGVAYAVHDTPRMISLALEMLSESNLADRARNCCVSMKIHCP